MESKKNVNQTLEIKDEELDAVSGGVSRGTKQELQPCKGNCGRETSNPTGYCEDCLEKLNKLGVHPSI